MTDRLNRSGDVSAACVMRLALAAAMAFAGRQARGTESDLPDAKPVPDMQVLPLPYDQASFQHLERELTRYHFGSALQRPFWYPLIGPEGRSLTRMGHPRDPLSHRHHYSVWISHNDVAGLTFWADGNPQRIVHQRIDQFEDGPESAWMLSRNAWQDREGKAVLFDQRRAEVIPISNEREQMLSLAPPRPGQQAERNPVRKSDWLMLIDLRLEAPPGKPVTLGPTPFGMIGVRMAKTIGVEDGGGRILNSAGQVNEKPIFHRPARWVDYSGRVTNQQTGGITLMDHPANPGHPTPFHVRGDGWMGACLTLLRPLTIEPGKPVRLRYGLWVHAGLPTQDQAERQWQEFAKRPLPGMDLVRK